MPGQAPTIPVTGVATGIPTTPLLARIEKRRAQVALLGDRLLKLREESGIANDQVTIAQTKLEVARQALLLAEQQARSAPGSALKSAAAMPPGTIGSGLQGLDGLARIQRGEPAGDQAAVRRLALAQAAVQSADAEIPTVTGHAGELTTQLTELTAQHTRQQTALTKLEQTNAAAIAADEAAQAARDRRLGAEYLGSFNGQAADPRALAALAYAKAQIGDPYVWAAEGPNSFDCSGLMWAAYHYRGDFELRRVSRDQYDQTSKKSVDRYSLVPGDLLFFSSTNSWTGIHHVAMYAGGGMMVEAPRTGLDVRLVPVRWSRLFQATRVYGAVAGRITPDPTPAPTTPPRNPTPPTPRPPTPGPTPTTPSPSAPSPSAPSPSAPSPSTPDPTPSTSGPSPTPSQPEPTSPVQPSASPSGGSSSGTPPSASPTTASPTGSGSSSRPATGSASSSSSSAGR
jgi:cell wall-associated NlpC family hydrolase